MSSGANSPNSYRPMRCIVKMRRSSMLRRILCRLLKANASHAAGTCPPRILLFAPFHGGSRACNGYLKWIVFRANFRIVQHRAGETTGFERTCQSAWMGLVRRWQFQLNMKTLSADVMSALGASFLLHRSCKLVHHVSRLYFPTLYV